MCVEVSCLLIRHKDAMNDSPDFPVQDLYDNKVFLLIMERFLNGMQTNCIS